VTEITLLTLLRETIQISLLLSMPVLLIGTFMGVLVSIVQTATSIQEQSLSFIPKLLATLLTLVLLGPWMLSTLMAFTVRLLGTLQTFGR